MHFTVLSELHVPKKKVTRKQSLRKTVKFALIFKCWWCNSVSMISTCRIFIMIKYTTWKHFKSGDSMIISSISVKPGGGEGGALIPLHPSVYNIMDVLNLPPGGETIFVSMQPYNFNDVESFFHMPVIRKDCENLVRTIKYEAEKNQLLSVRIKMCQSTPSHW